MSQLSGLYIGGSNSYPGLASYNGQLNIVGVNAVDTIVFGAHAYINKNFDHGAQTTPTLYIHSDENPDTDNTEWIAFTHDGSEAVITSGKGQIHVNSAIVGLGMDTSGDEIVEILNSGNSGQIKLKSYNGANGIYMDTIVNDGTIGLSTRIQSTAYNLILDVPAGKVVEIDADSLRLDAGLIRNITTVNAATYDLLVTDDIVHVTYTGTGAVTSLTLPTAQTLSGRTIIIKDAGGNAGTNNITIDTEGAQTIDGSATAVISANYDSITLYSDGTNWFII